MTRILRSVSFFVIVVMLILPVAASPNLADLTRAGPLMVVPDDRRLGLYYFLPGDLRLASDPDGQPGLRLLQMRYLGTRAAGDQGTEVYRSLMSVRIIMDGPEPGEVEEARRMLAAANPRRTAELRPLPVERIEAVLLYAPVGKAESVLPNGYFDAAGEEGRTNRSAFWRERTFTVRLDPHDAQLVWSALHEQQVVFSLGYAFFATGLAPDKPLATLAGSPALVREIEDSLRGDEGAGESEEVGNVPHLVKAGAASIVVDFSRWPGLVRRIDVNEQLPPGYPLLEIYCYDFHDRLRPDLELKKVEVEAVGVSGSAVGGYVLFERTHPDLYAQALRLPFAVRMDQPYRYRVTEVGCDGSMVGGDWLEMTSWARLLDVTTPAKEFEEHDPGLTEEKQQ